MATTITRENVIVSYEAKTSGFIKEQNKLKQSNSSLTKSLNGTASKLAALGLAAGALAAFRGAAILVDKFNSSMKQLESLTGLTGEPLDFLKDKAIELSQTFGTSAVEIVDAFGKVGSAAPQLLGNADALAEVTKQADILAKAGGITLDAAIEALTGTMNQYGLEAKEAANITDILATSQQLGTARISDIAQSFKNVGSAASGLGIGVEQTNAMLQALAKNSITGSEAGIKLRNVLLKLASSGREDLNPATQEFSDILEVLSKEGFGEATKGAKFFGVQNLTAAQALINNKQVVEDLNGSLLDHGNALAQATINTDTNSAAAARAAAKWDALILSIDTGDGVFSKISRSVISLTGDLLDLLIAMNKGLDLSKGFTKEALDFNKAAEDMASVLVAVDAGWELGRFTQEELSKAVEGSITSLNRYGKRLGEVEENITDYTAELKRFEEIGLSNTKVEKELAQAIEEKATLLAVVTRLETLQSLASEELAEQQAALVESTEDQNEAFEDQVLTLGLLKKQLAEAKAARDKITIGDAASFATNTKLIKSLEAQIKVYDLKAEAEKKNLDLAQQRLQAERALEALRISLIEDDLKREIAMVELQGKVKGDKIKEDLEKEILTEEQAAESLILIAELTNKEIIALNRKRFEDLRKMREEFASNLQSSVDDDRVAEQEAIELEAQERLLQIRKQYLEQLKAVSGESAEERNEKRLELEEIINDEILRSQISALEDQLLVTGLKEEERLQLKTDLTNALIELNDLETERFEENEKKKTDAQKKAEAERRQAIQDAINNSANFLTELFAQEEARIKNSISLQEERVKKAKELASSGSENLVKIEQERLDKLNEAREKSAQKQRAIAAIQIAANSAVAVSEGIVAVIAGFKEGNLVKGIATAIALAATIGSSILAIRGALADAPAFATGVDKLNGPGSGKSDSIVARLSNGEGVIPAENNTNLLKTGIGVTDKRLPGLVQAGILASNGLLVTPLASSTNPGNSTQSNNFKGLEGKISENTETLKNMGLFLNVDHKGIEAGLGKRNRLRERRNKQRR